MERTCKKCGETKPIEEFRKNGKYKTKQRYGNCCKLCYNSSRKSSRKSYYIKNKDNLLAKQREYRNNNKEIIYERQREYRQSEKYKLTKGRRNESQKKSAVKHREKNILKKRLRVKNLADTYIIQTIKVSCNMTLDEIKRHPELIELMREEMKVKRLLRGIKGRFDPQKYQAKYFQKTRERDRERRNENNKRYKARKRLIKTLKHESTETS